MGAPRRERREAASRIILARDFRKAFAHIMSHVGPDALVRAGEQSSPENAAAYTNPDHRVPVAFGLESRRTAELRSAGQVGAPAPTRAIKHRDYRTVAVIT